MMAKFNGKRGKNRNLAESVLNAYFNSAGVGTKGSKPVKKKVPKMHYGGGIPFHLQTPGHENNLGLSGQNNMIGGQGNLYENWLAQQNVGGMGGNINMMNYQNQNFLQKFGSTAGGGLYGEGAGLGYNVPTEENTTSEQGLNPGQVSAAMAKFLEEQGQTSLKSTGVSSAGAAILNSEFAQGDKKGSGLATAAGGAMTGYGAAMPYMAAIPGVGLFTAAGGAMLAHAKKAHGEFKEEREKAKQLDKNTEMLAERDMEYSNYMNNENIYDPQGGGMTSYYAKYGGAVADFSKKYGLGGSTSNSEFEKAFAAARQAGQSTFMFQGKPYTTDRADQSEGASTQDAPNFMLANPDTLGGVATANPNQDFRSPSMQLYGFEQPNDGPIGNLAYAPMIAGGFQGLGVKSLVKGGLKNAAKTQLSNVQPTSRIDDIAYSLQRSFGNRNVGANPQLQPTTKLGDAAYELQRRFGQRNYNLGGATGQADYETEGGEVMLASPGDAPVAVGNGNYKQVASNLYQAEGPAHEGGGIATQGATEPFMDASGQSHDSPYVFSDSEDMTFDATDILKLIS